MQRRYSVAKIETSQTYDKGRPKLGGLSDPRLGTMDRSLKCTTGWSPTSYEQQHRPGTCPVALAPYFLATLVRVASLPAALPLSFLR